MSLGIVACIEDLQLSSLGDETNCRIVSGEGMNVYHWIFQKKSTTDLVETALPGKPACIHQYVYVYANMNI